MLNYKWIARDKQFLCCWVLRHFLTSQVTSVAFYIEREKSDKFSSMALISVWGSFTCCKSTTRDQRFYFPPEGSHSQDFYALKKNRLTPAGFEPANLGSSGEYDNHRTTGVDQIVSIGLLYVGLLIWRIQRRGRKKAVYSLGEWLDRTMYV